MILGIAIIFLAKPIAFRHVASILAILYGVLFQFGMNQGWSFINGGVAMLCFSFALIVIPVLAACFLSELIKHQGKYWYVIDGVLFVQIVIFTHYAWVFYGSWAMGVV